MKRPFAVLGFSMLAASLMIYNMSLKATVAVIITAAVAFCLLLLLSQFLNQVVHDICITHEVQCKPRSLS